VPQPTAALVISHHGYQPADVLKDIETLAQDERYFPAIFLMRHADEEPQATGEQRKQDYQQHSISRNTVASRKRMKRQAQRMYMELLP